MKAEVIILLIITACLWGTTPVLEKMGLGKTDPLTGVTIRSLAVTIALLLYTTVTGRIGQIFKADGRTIAIFSITGLMAGLFGMVTYFAALKKGATSEIVPIAATYPLITAVLSILILGEQVTALRLAGTVCIILGIWLVQL